MHVANNQFVDKFNNGKKMQNCSFISKISPCGRHNFKRFSYILLKFVMHVTNNQFFELLSSVLLLFNPYPAKLIKAPPYQGEAFSSCTVSSAGACGRRRAWTLPLIHVTLISTKPLFQFIWCSTY